MGEEKTSSNQTLGVVFMTIGAGMMISMGLTLGVAFIGTGLPFLVLGIIFMNRKEGDGE